ncbi:hypothetical protein ACJ2A9_04860 [Anaerobacillus sp. MEB173]|uniref:hypothetical protein n=1 Tax=Anaerobacillus sp. MEB173 TaxID=3383345 RepID=UPI003F91AE68
MMIGIRKALLPFLKEIHPQVYFQFAPSDAPFPYLVYDLPMIIDEGEYGQQIITLDVDGWDRPVKGDTTDLEMLMSKVNDLNKKTLTTDELVVSFYLDQKMTLTDNDKSIRRRKYVFTGRLIERG